MYHYYYHVAAHKSENSGGSKQMLIKKERKYFWKIDEKNVYGERNARKTIAIILTIIRLVILGQQCNFFLNHPSGQRCVLECPGITLQILGG